MSCDPSTLPDRRMHARRADAVLVRYERAGKWFVEWGEGEKHAGRRQAVTIKDAVELARKWRDVHDGTIFFNVPGGQSFDAKVRKADNRG